MKILSFPLLIADALSKCFPCVKTASVVSDWASVRKFSLSLLLFVCVVNSDDSKGGHLW